MKVDQQATQEAPAGWEIWTTGRKWQAMRIGAKEGDVGAWGPLRRSQAEAIRDAQNRNVPPSTTGHK